jgi:hypothetical protein
LNSAWTASSAASAARLAEPFTTVPVIEDGVFSSFLNKAISFRFNPHARLRHCEEDGVRRGNLLSAKAVVTRDCFASLAMTALLAARRTQERAFHEIASLRSQ